ncbi:MAG: 3-methyl-2-oxobutanoate hydroxymethyltransferase [Candidatus Eisenbacteria bacterium]
MPSEKITARMIRERKGKGKISVLTCYDFPMAKILDRAGIDILLVGDSLANVVLGYDTTLPVTMEEMIHHGRAVARARPRALLVVDMPFGSFQCGADAAVANAVRLMKETGADAVKLEGGRRNAEAVSRMVAAGIPVMGHLGLTPQSVHAFGGYRVQGRGLEEGDRLLEEARALEAAGCFSIVLESVPAALAKRITASIGIPTIGIGAGADCDGQVLVLYDMLGLFEEFRPKFVKHFASLAAEVERAVREYKREVEEGRFPDAEHSFGEGKAG